jgi:hypothetical protein
MAAADEEDAGKRRRTHACEGQHGVGTDTAAWGRAAWAVGGGDGCSMGRGMGPQHGAGPLHGQRRWPWVWLRRRTGVRSRELQGRLRAMGHWQRYGPMFWGNRGGGAGRGGGAAAGSTRCLRPAAAAAATWATTGILEPDILPWGQQGQSQQQQ